MKVDNLLHQIGHLKVLKLFFTKKATHLLTLNFEGHYHEIKFMTHH